MWFLMMLLIFFLITEKLRKDLDIHKQSRELKIYGRGNRRYIIHPWKIKIQWHDEITLEVKDKKGTDLQITHIRQTQFSVRIYMHVYQKTWYLSFFGLLHIAWVPISPFCVNVMTSLHLFFLIRVCVWHFLYPLNS